MDKAARALRPWRRQRVIGAVGVTVLGVAAVLMVLGRMRSSRSSAEVRTVPVVRQDLPLYVVERGELDSQNVVEIKCEVPRGASSRGVRILYIVPDGARVKKGDLLIEFESTWVAETRYKVLAAYYRSQAYKIWRDASYEKEAILSQIRLTQAQLDLERAKLRLEQFEDEAGGRFAMDLQQARMDLEHALTLLAEGKARLLLERDRLEGVRMLFERGYRSKGDLDQATFAFLQARDMLTRAENAVRTAEANILKLKRYIYPYVHLDLIGAVRNARLQLELVHKESVAKLDELAALRDAAARQLQRQEYLLRRFDEWLEACRVYSPVDGIVVYRRRRTPWRRGVGAGELAYYRMTVLRIPDLAHMQVELEVHEAVVGQLKVGQKADIVIDGIPGKVFKGTVASVDRTPDQRREWHERSVNVYDVVVTIDGEVEGLNPGMTATVKIHTGKVEQTLLIPITAAFRRAGKWWCFVMGRRGPELREIVPGKSNDLMLAVEEGVAEGERVVVDPYELPLELLPPEMRTPGSRGVAAL